MKKSKVTAFLVLVGILFLSGDLFASDKKFKYTAEDIYTFFAQSTPEDVMNDAKRAASYFSNVAQQAKGLDKKKKEDLFHKALIWFHKAPSKWPWKNFPLLPFIVVLSCAEERVIAHPTKIYYEYTPEKNFFEVMSKPGFVKQYRDVTGRKIALELCNKIDKSPNGVWAIQKQWWPETDKPLTMGFYMVSIPNSSYQIHSLYPTRKYSEQDLNALVK